jgi:hypothetical protein
MFCSLAAWGTEKPASTHQVLYTIHSYAGPTQYVNRSDLNRTSCFPALEESVINVLRDRQIQSHLSRLSNHYGFRQMEIEYALETPSTVPTVYFLWTRDGGEGLPSIPIQYTIRNGCRVLDLESTRIQIALYTEAVIALASRHGVGEWRDYARSHPGAFEGLMNGAPVDSDWQLNGHVYPSPLAPNAGSAF